MGLVVYALKYRITFYVLAVLVLFLGISGVVSSPKDVLPVVNIPVVNVIWTYTGLSTKEMEQRVTTYSEFGLTNNVNGIKNIESTTLQGVTVEKIYFQPDVNIDLAIAQVVSSVNSIRAVMPPGIQPPIVLRYSASQVPVIQLSLTSDKESEQALFDYAQYRVRQALITQPGITIPAPYGGKQRQIMVEPRSEGAERLRPHAVRRDQRGDRAEPHPALGSPRSSAPSSTWSAPTRRRPASRR